jgi:hypothetical protein
MTHLKELWLRYIGQSGLRVTNTMWDAVQALIATLSITNN